MSKRTVVIFVVAGCILLAVAGTALWAATNLFNPERFGRQVAEGMQSEKASQALAETIVNSVADQYPDFPQLARGPTEEFVTWLLQREVFAPAFRKVAAVANVIMTTSAEDVIGIDLSQAMLPVVSVVTSIAPETGPMVQTAANRAQANGPLVIFESDRLPRLRRMANTVHWLWPLTGLAALALLVAAYLRAKDQRRALTTIGIGVLITGIMIPVLLPALQAPVRNSITSPNLRIVITEVLSTLSQNLIIQSLLLSLVGVLLIVAGPAVHTRLQQPRESRAPKKRSPRAPG